MTEIPKAPVFLFKDHGIDELTRKIPLSDLCIENRVNRFIAAEWAKVFEGAYICETTSVGCDPSPDERGCATQVRLKPVPIKKPGVTKSELREFRRFIRTPNQMDDMLKRILDEGLAGE